MSPIVYSATELWLDFQISGSVNIDTVDPHAVHGDDLQLRTVLKYATGELTVSGERAVTVAAL